MANGANADVHKIFATQARQDRFVNFVFAKCRGIPLEAEALQPLCGIHGVVRMCLLEPANTTCSARRNRTTTAKALRLLHLNQIGGVGGSPAHSHVSHDIAVGATAGSRLQVMGITVQPPPACWSLKKILRGDRLSIRHQCGQNSPPTSCQRDRTQSYGDATADPSRRSSCWTQATL